jgi:hypothetical protein
MSDERNAAIAFGSGIGEGPHCGAGPRAAGVVLADIDNEMADTVIATKKVVERRSQIDDRSRGARFFESKHRGLWVRNNIAVMQPIFGQHPRTHDFGGG